MRTPNAALLAVTTGLAFNAMPATAMAQENQPATNPEAAALNAQAGQLMGQLGGKLLTLKKTAAHNHHAEHVFVRSEVPNSWAVEIDYNGKRPSRHAPLGKYVVSGGFASKSRNVKPKDINEIEVTAKAGRGGPLVDLELRKDDDGGYSFKGSYEYAKRHYKVELDASTQPEAGQQALNSSNIAALATQFRRLMKLAPTGAAVKKLLPPAFSIMQPGLPTLEPLPTTPIPPTIVSPPPVPSPAPEQPTPPTLQDPFASGNVGVDVSFPNCNAHIPADAKFGIVGINNGLVFSTNPCLRQEAAHFTGKIAYYGNISFNENSTHLDPSVCAADDSAEQCLEKEAYQYGWDAGVYDMQALRDAGLDPHVEFNEDMESRQDSTWSDNPQLNRNAIQGMHDAVLANGAASFTIYTTTVNYRDITDKQTDQGVERFNTGWNEWGATSETSAQAASQYCVIEPFTGTNPTTGIKGVIKRIQYLDPNTVDHDYQC